MNITKDDIGKLAIIRYHSGISVPFRDGVLVKIESVSEVMMKVSHVKGDFIYTTRIEKGRVICVGLTIEQFDRYHEFCIRMQNQHQQMLIDFKENIDQMFKEFDNVQNDD